MRNRSARIICGGLVTGGLLAQSVMAHPGHDEKDTSEQPVTVNAASQPERPRPSGIPGVDDRQMEVIELPAPEVSITIEGDKRVIRANGLPNHETGEFPNAGNPNALRPQSHVITLPLVPTIADEPIVARPEFGIAINGVIFDAGTGEFWTAENDRAFGGGSPWNYEALGGGVPLGLDQNNAHVQPTGKYHYHGVPTGLLHQLLEGHDGSTMVHLGWAYDGFPIYAAWGYADPNDPNSEVRPLRSSYKLKDGERPARPDGPGGKYDGTFGLDYEYVEGLGDLDECNGRFGVTPEYPQGTYYYVITDEFPSIPRLWRGEPAESFRNRGPGPGPGMEDGPGGGRGDRGGAGPNGRGPGGMRPPPPGQRPQRPQRPGE
ncbi:MAG: YHYH protein [Phycisphaerales bacterium JB065]